MEQVWRAYSSWRPFSQDEAWLLFKLAAIAEAVGWSLLITGLAIQRYLMHGNDYAVQLAGRTHGLLFLWYVAATLVFGPSLRWPFWKSIVALLASVPPYGSLLFELIESHHREHQTMYGMYALILVAAV